MKTIIPLILMALSYSCLFWYLHTSYDSLPQHVASHFNAQGRPNGWMSPAECVQYTEGFALLIPAVALVLMTVGCPRLFDHGLWLGCLFALFATGIHWQIVQSKPRP